MKLVSIIFSINKANFSGLPAHIFIYLDYSRTIMFVGISVIRNNNWT